MSSLVTQKQSIQIPVSVLEGVTKAIQKECRRQLTEFVDKAKTVIANESNLTEEEVVQKSQVIVDELCNRESEVKPVLKAPKEKKVKVVLNSPEDATEQKQLKSLKVSQLSAYLKGAKLNSKGKKDVLIERTWRAVNSPETLTDVDRKIQDTKKGRPASKKKTAEVVEVSDELTVDEVAEEVSDDEFKTVLVKTENEDGIKMVVDKKGEGIKEYFFQPDGDEVFEKVKENGQDEYWLVGMFVKKDGVQQVDFDADVEDDEAEEE
tara:strand:+ start:720 stop:1511 length:792 start_codon:yes stop_codon:yes gene_type:complete